VEHSSGAHQNLKHFVTFNVIEKNMKWSFNLNSHVEDKLSHYQVMGNQFGCSGNL